MTTTNNDDDDGDDNDDATLRAPDPSHTFNRYLQSSLRPSDHHIGIA